jgi:hypothetical protein
MVQPVLGADCKHVHRCFERSALAAVWVYGYKACPVCKKIVDINSLVSDKVLEFALKVIDGNEVEISGENGYVRTPEATQWIKVEHQ